MSKECVRVLTVNKSFVGYYRHLTKVVQFTKTAANMCV